MFGNNIRAAKLYRLRVPLFYVNGEIYGTGNRKYFFPETPVLDNSTIVGIEAHLSTQFGAAGDITRVEGQEFNASKPQARGILVTIYGEDKSQSFSSIPLFSLFPNIAGTFKKVKPYYGKINTRMSYCLLTNPVGSELDEKVFVNFTFYYNPNKKK